MRFGVGQASWSAILVFAVLLLSSCGKKKPPLPIYGEIPDFTLTTHTGEQFGRRFLEGKIWVADFIFTNCPGPCPRMSYLMKKIQDSLHDRPEVRLVSFTVDPERDTPDVLAAYAKRYQAEAGRWYFLTGPEQTLNMLSREAFKLGSVGAGLDHSTRFVLVDQRGRVRGYYWTSEDEGTKQLLLDIQRLCEDPS